MPSENGWEPAWVDQDQLNWVDIPGCDVRIQTQKGLPTAILRAWIADHNEFIEPVRDRYTASYTPTNSVSTSNHLNGTAADINWDSHPFHAKGTFTPEQMKTLHEMLDFYEGTIYWAGDWDDPIDEMHVQLGYGTYGNAHTADFVSRKIRADGRSTFRRGNNPSLDDPAKILAAAVGLDLSRATEILSAVQQGLRLSGCTNVNRIAMWLAQVGHESGSFQYTEEKSKTGRYAPYIGRTWIQITWDYHYRQFGQWAKSKGLINEEDFFFNNPERLADLKWAGLGAAWYWTVSRPQLNSLSDAGDLLAVTKAINGGNNGMVDRNDRFKRARALGDELLLLLDTGDDMAAVPQEQWDRVYRELTQLHESLSGYRTPGEGPIGTWSQIDRNKDKMLHELYVETRAIRDGDPDSIGRIVCAAAGGGADSSPEFIAHAMSVLVRLENENPAAFKAYLAKGVK